MNDKLTQTSQVRIMQSAAKIQDLETLQNSKVHDAIDLLSKESTHRPLNTIVNVGFLPLYGNFVYRNTIMFFQHPKVNS